MINLNLREDGTATLDGEPVAPFQEMNAESTSINIIARWSRERGMPLDVRLEDDHGVSLHRIDGTQEPFTVVSIPGPEPVPEDDHLDLPLEEDFATEEIAVPQVAVRGTAWNDLFGEDSPIANPSAKQRERRKRNSRRGKILVASVSVALLLGAGGVWALSQSDGERPNEEVVAQQLSDSGIEMDRSVGKDKLPGYSMTPQWELDIDPKSAFAAYGAGLVEVSPKNITIYDPRTGGKVRSIKNGNPDLDFLIETTVSGKPSIVWMVDDTLHMWNQSMGKDQHILKEKLQEPSISDSGSGLLILSKGKTFTLQESGLEEIQPTDGVEGNPLTYDGGNLVYSGWSGPIKVTNPSRELISSSDIEAPFDDAEITKWVSVGHGRAALAWSSEREGDFITLNNIKTGRIDSQAAVEGDYLENGKWIRGQGLQVAVFGPLMFNLKDGQLIADGSERHISFTQAKGTFGMAKSSGKTILTQGGRAWETSLDLLGVVDDESAIIRSGKDKVISVGKK